MTQESVLIVRLSSLGDVVHALPAVSALRAAQPRARIDWVIERRWSPLLEGNPDVDRVIALDTLRFRRAARAAGAGFEFWTALGKLRAASYHCVVDLQGLFKSALLAAWTGAPRRLGFSERFLREPACAAFYTEAVTPRGAHIIEQNLSLVARLGARDGGARMWRFPLPRSEAAERYAREQLARRGIREFVVLNPGGGWRGKCWPPERYGELSDALRGHFGWPCIATYGPGEEPLVREVQRAARSSSPLSFATNLPELIALLRRAQLFVGGDSGPLHLAAALSTPLVGLYGPTSPERNGPFSSQDVVLHHAEACRETRWREPRYTPCMASITVEEVVAAAKQRLERAAHA